MTGLRWERIGPPPVEWGLTLCGRSHCAETAVLLLDGWPFCLEHAEDELERAVAWELNPELVKNLPSLEEWRP